MFRIGEFSQIARVSGRLLRYYDSLGLLRPVRIDPATGFRYYSADQLPRLNSILALKELGLSLDQIAKMVDDKIGPEEIRGMLMLKKAELEQSLIAEQSRLRHIESRLKQIEEQGALADYDVVVKRVPAQPYLAVRSEFAGMPGAVAMLRTVLAVTRRAVPAGARGPLIVVAHSDFDDEKLDLEIGIGLNEERKLRVPLPDKLEMKPTELPAIEISAAVVRGGPTYQAHLAFGALGVWMEANGFTVAGPCREVFLEPPFQPPDEEHSVIEVQFPVAKAA
jgi:DNA-binding transcriptional MerR regulator